MLNNAVWKANVQKQGIAKRTYAIFDKVDLSQFVLSYSMKDFLDLDGKSSVYGAFGVREITIKVIGERPKYKKVAVSHGIFVSNKWNDESIGEYSITNVTYDERSDETTYVATNEEYDVLVPAPITKGTTPATYLAQQSVISVDATEWTLGSKIVVSSPGTAYYETYKEMAIDMAKCTMSFAIPRKGKLAYRSFVESNYELQYIFDAKYGEIMPVITALNLTTTLGDNITTGTKPATPHTVVAVNNLELIRSEADRLKNIPTMFAQIKNLTYQGMEIETVGNPLIELGDILTLKDINNKVLKLYVTKHEFTDKGYFTSKLTCEILTQEESNSNFVGEWSQAISETIAEVDKVNQTIILLASRVEKAETSITGIQIQLGKITASVENIHNGNVILGLNGDLDYLNWQSKQTGLYPSKTLRPSQKLLGRSDKSPTFFIEEYEPSLSKLKRITYIDGEDITPFGAVLPNEKYSYRGVRTDNMSRYQIYLQEFSERREPSANLIKDDFSDFTGFATATVSRDRTFPIEMFVGGLNLYKNSGFLEPVNRWQAGGAVDVVDGNIKVTTVTGASSGFDTGRNVPLVAGKKYELQYMVRSNNIGQMNYVYLLNNIGNMKLPHQEFPLNGEWHLIRQVFTTPSNYLVDSGILIGTGAPAGNSLEIKQNSIKVSEVFDDDWSPAPEDAYGLNLPNGAWHYRTNGGTHQIKVVNEISPYTPDLYYQLHLVNYSGNRMMVRSLPTENKPYIQNNQRVQVEFKERGQYGFRLLANSADNDLNLIMSHPSIRLFGPTERLLLDTVTPKRIETASMTLRDDTVAVKLRYVTKEGLGLTDEMFNRGDPKEWFANSEGIKIWAQSEISILKGEIDLSTQSINAIDGKINNAGININADDGVKIYGKNLEVMNEDRTRTILRVVTENRQEQIEMFGKLSSGVDGNMLRFDGGRIMHETTQSNIPVLWFQDGSTIINGRAGVGPYSGNITMQLYGHMGSRVAVQYADGHGLTSVVGSDTVYVFSPKSATLRGNEVTDIGSNDKVNIDAGKTLSMTSRENVYLNSKDFMIQLGTNLFLVDKKISNNAGVFLNNGAFSPSGNTTLGNASYRYPYIYLSNQPNVSSDVKGKYNITDIDPLLLDSFEGLHERYFKTKHDDKHSYGYIAQEVEACLYDFANKVWDEDEVEVQMELFKLLNRDENGMSLLYAEVQIIMQAVERRRNDRLESELNEIKEVLKKAGMSL